MEKIYIVYKFTNTITGDFYIGSQSIKKRLANNKYQSVWIGINDLVDQDIQKYGLDNFELEILAVVEPEQLKEVEQQFIEELKPTYNNYNENDWDTERYKKNQKEYYNQLCCYEGKTLTLNALSTRFSRMGIPHPTIEAKKYLIGGIK